MNRYVTAGLLDQGLSSLGSLLLSVTVLRLAPVREGAEFAEVFILFSLSVGLARSLTTEPQAVLAPRDDGMHVATHAVVASGVGTFVIAAGLVVFRPESGLAYASSAAAVSAVALDSARQTHIAARDSGSALQLTGVAAATTALGCAVGILGDSPTMAVSAWGVGSLIGLAVMRFKSAAVSFQHARPETWTYALEYAATSGATQLSLLVSVALFAPSLALAIRVLNTAFGPYLVVFQGAATLLIPIAVSLLRQGRLKPLSIAAFTSLFLTSGCLAYGLFVGALDYALAALFGDSWRAGSDSFTSYVGYMCAGALVTGPLLTLRATGLIRLSLTYRMVNGTLLFIFPLVGALFRGAAGYFAFAAVAGLLSALFGFRLCGKLRLRG